jgi:hypothetical protein
MKMFLYLFGMAGAGALGYLAEPSLRLQLTGIAPGQNGGTATGNGIQSLPDGATMINLANLAPHQLPQLVLLKADVQVTDPASNIVMILQKGNRVKLIRIDGVNAIVSPGDGPFQGSIPVVDTDIVQQLAAAPPAPTNIPTTLSGGDSEEPAVTPAPPPAPQPPPVAPPTPEPAPAPAPEPAVTPEPAPPPPVEPAPAPVETAPAPEVGASDVVKVMQDSIRTGQIKEFTLEQVLDWSIGAAETVDGETYQTGLASYKAETIFGVKTIQAKALVKGGKVQRWIWPKSGMEIK